MDADIEVLVFPDGVLAGDDNGCVGVVAVCDETVITDSCLAI